MADPPQWFTRKEEFGHSLADGMWPVFTRIRTRLIEQIPGGVSHICKLMLREFKVLEEGILLPHANGPFVMRCVFAGFIADLLAHKAILCSKGSPYGVRPCWNCANLTSRKPLAPSQIGYMCHDRSKFLRFNDVELFAMLDRLHREAPALSNAQRDKLETEVGFHVEPAGLLMDIDLRSIYSPCDHHHRDWMHTIVSDGVANWETAGILHAMKSCPANVHLRMVQTFMMKCVLPKQRGKAQPEWLADARLKAETMKSFASTMLTIISVMTIFLDHFPQVSHYLPSVTVSRIESGARMCKILVSFLTREIFFWSSKFMRIVGITPVRAHVGSASAALLPLRVLLWVLPELFVAVVHLLVHVKSPVHIKYSWL